jgi:drug/metabolite transporter (DMT)-like permease
VLTGVGLRAVALLGLAVVLFGSSWPVMKAGLSGASPLWFATARLGLGAMGAMVLLAAMRRLHVPSRRDLPIVVTIGVCQLTLFLGFSQLGLQYLEAGRSSVLAYTTTLFLVPLTRLTGERIDRWQAAGSIFGLAGVAVLLAPQSIDWNDRDVLVGHLWLLMAAASWALAIFHARRHDWHRGPLELLPWQMLLATVLLAFLSAVFERDGHIEFAPGVLLCLGYLGLVAGPTASWAATSVSRLVPTVVSSLGFLGVPVLGLAISALWLGEEIDLPLAAGAALILSGVGAVAVGFGRRNAATG